MENYMLEKSVISHRNTLKYIIKLIQEKSYVCMNLCSVGSDGIQVLLLDISLHTI